MRYTVAGSEKIVIEIVPETSAAVNATGTIPSLVNRLLLRCAEAERQFIAAFWLSPVAGYLAAADAELCVRSFSDHRLGVIFFYACRCAQLRTRPTIDGCLAVADHYEPGMIPVCDYGWVYRLVMDTDTEAGRVGHYAKRLRKLAGIRQGRARAALAEYAQLAAGDEFTITIAARPHVAVRGSACSRRRVQRPRIVA